MPDTKPSEPESTAPSDESKTPAAKQDAPFVWPRDLNTPSTTNPEWGSDPEALRDA